jgi:hypothetical protein
VGSAPKLSRGNDVAKAMDYMLKRWIAFTRFLDDGRICLSNNAAERGVRLRRLDRFMTEPQRDHGAVDAGLQQFHRSAVPQHVR